jgi:hypothetical protein
MPKSVALTLVQAPTLPGKACKGPERWAHTHPHSYSPTQYTRCNSEIIIDTNEKEIFILRYRSIMPLIKDGRVNLL